MLSRSQRLSVEQFNAVMEKGRVTHSSLFLIRSIGGMPDTRIAATAPQKTSKSAVIRNKMRRKMYEAIRTIGLGAKPGIKPGAHAIIFAKPTMLKAKQAELVSDIKALFVKSGILM